MRTHIHERSGVQCCKNCRHFGQLKGIAGVVRATICLAPANEGERFVYETSPHGECELFTPNVKGHAPASEGAASQQVGGDNDPNKSDSSCSVSSFRWGVSWNDLMDRVKKWNLLGREIVDE